MSYTVCNTVTRAVSPHVSNDVRTHVQNQNQNQRFWLLKPVVVSGIALHASHRYLQAPVRLAALPHTPCDALAPLAGEES